MSTPAAPIKRLKTIKKKTQKQNKERNGSSQKLVAPVSAVRTIRNPRPAIRYTEDGSCVVTHREYFSDLACTTAFTVGQLSPTTFNQGMIINPGNPAMFPWLSRMAIMFESYVFERLEFGYFSEVSTATAGRVILAVDYDVGDPPPTTKTQAMGNKAAMAATAWGECVLRCDPADLHKRKSFFTDTTSTPAQAVNVSDPGLKFTGTFLPCTQGGTGGVTGELYVAYTIRLTTPHIPPAIYGNVYVTVSATAGLTASNLWGPTATIQGGDLQGSMTNVTGVFTFLVPGLYIFRCHVSGTVLSSTTNHATSGNVASWLPTWNEYYLIDSGAIEGQFSLVLNVRTAGATFTPRLTSATTVTGTHWTIGLLGTPV